MRILIGNYLYMPILMSIFARMQTHIDQRNEQLAAHLVRHLESRNMKAVYCPTAREAVEKVSEMIPDGATVSWGGSATIRSIGLPDALHSRTGLKVLDRDRATTTEEAIEIYHKALWADYYLSSANAISEDGVIVNIDGTGNRVAAITYGPEHVIFIIGLNKVAQNVEAAIARARSTASPINAARFDIKTPCKTDGTCHNCTSPDSICNYIHLLRHSPRQRHTVVLVGEGLRY